MTSILLVDDDSSILITSSIALRRRGYEVTVAHNGQQALKKLAQRTFDILISDVQMPGISGLELASLAQKLPSVPRVFLVSAHSDLPVKSKDMEAFFRKPLDMSALYRALGSPLKSC